MALSCYFDVFPLLSPEPLAESADWACSRLGMETCTFRRKSKGLLFSPTFEALGTTADGKSLMCQLNVARRVSLRISAMDGGRTSQA